MTAISVQNLSKVYKLYDSKKDRLKEAISPLKKKYHRDFYALNDISFEVKQGETVGLIGKNGSGKSTLLKMITGLITPTSGSIAVNGKVSALLELGAGFNPEYTGLENIFLNGTIMGFTREEMGAKLDDIVNFADIGDFIHQPVKMYSSGMSIRLAFAVAINVEPDILIIDEALAVGDIRFQQKCYRKINSFREQGKTILFCTHDTGAVLNLCSTCLWLHDGQIKSYGEPDEIVEDYKSYMFFEQSKTEVQNVGAVKTAPPEKQTLPWVSVKNCAYYGEGGAEITEVCFYKQETGQAVTVLRGGEEVIIGIKAVGLSSLEKPFFGFLVKNSYGVDVFGTNTVIENITISTLNKNEYVEVFFPFTFPLLTNGAYAIDVAISEGTQGVHVNHCWKYDVFCFNIGNIGDKYSVGSIYLQPINVNVQR
jgi:ABC-type polysaccharide/polyol phosphate transport system ATPase subunit